MKTQHTPGPWTVTQHEKGHIVSGQGTDAPWLPHVAEVWREPDARLIAAAPRMLEALRHFAEFADDARHFDLTKACAEARAILRDVDIEEAK